MILRCTKKLLDVIRPEQLATQEPDGSDWYGNLLVLDRRKCLLLTHADTLFTIFEPDVRAPDLRSTHDLVAPILFTLGNRDLLGAPSEGMCGSRHTSEQERHQQPMACGEEGARHGLTIVSGYAKGVDTQTHLANLKEGGSTVIVLAEGINYFRKKRDFADTGLPLTCARSCRNFNLAAPGP